MTCVKLLIATSAVVILYLIGFLLTAWMRRRVTKDLDTIPEPPKCRPGDNWRGDAS